MTILSRSASLAAVARYAAIIVALTVWLSIRPSWAADKVLLSFSASTAFGNAFLAKDAGIFSQKNIDVEMKLVPNSTTTIAALLAGSIQIAGVTPPNALQAIDQGLDLVVLAGGRYFSTTSEDIAVVVKPDSSIREAKDFVGRRVALPGLNGLLDVMFRRWLADNGVDYSKIVYTETPFAQQGDVLRAGQVDAILAVQPYLGRILDQSAGRVVSYFAASKSNSGEDIRLSAAWFMATRKWVKDNPAVAEAFQTAMREATALSRSDKAAVRKAILTYVPFPPDAQAKLPESVFDDRVSERQVESWISIMKTQKMISRSNLPTNIIVAHGE